MQRRDNEDNINEIINKFDKLKVSKQNFILDYVRAAERQAAERQGKRTRERKLTISTPNRQETKDRYGETIQVGNRVLILTKGSYNIRAGDPATVKLIRENGTVEIYPDRIKGKDKDWTYRQPENLEKINKDIHEAYIDSDTSL